MAKVDLTDTEWMSLIDRTRDGLPPCCAEISELRELIACLAMEGGDVQQGLGPTIKLDILEMYRVVAQSHDFGGLAVLGNLVTQLQAAKEGAYE